MPDGTGAPEVILSPNSLWGLLHPNAAWDMHSKG